MKLSSRPVLYFHAFGLAAILATSSEVPFARESALHFLSAGKPDPAALLAPPPLMGSAEQAADMDEVKAVYRTSSSNDMAAANGEKKFSVFNFAEDAGLFLIETNLPRTKAFFQKVLQDTQAVTDQAKNHFRRPRPYTTDPSLANGKLEKTFSYPSGHSTESMVLALVLSDVLPDKSAAILAHARLVGWRRVQIARHYPTDIYAGRVLAQAIVHAFKGNEAFEKEFAEAKSEIEQAQKASATRK